VTVSRAGQEGEEAEVVVEAIQFVSHWSYSIFSSGERALPAPVAQPGRSVRKRLWWSVTDGGRSSMVSA